MAGRRPLPTKIKLLRGNPGHGPINTDEPEPPAGEPEMPRILSAAARRIWRKQLVPQLRGMGLLTKVDGLMLGAVCEAQATWEAATKEVQERGVLVEEPIVNKDGDVVGQKIKKNPACAIVYQFYQAMKSGLSEFGLTPASRSKIKIDKKPEDALDKLMSRKGVQQVEPAKDSAPTPVAFDIGNTGADISDELTNFDA